MHLKELKQKTPAELVEMAEELGVEGASTLRRQDIMFGILKEVAEDEEILGIGTIEVLQDGFGGPWDVAAGVVVVEEVGGVVHNMRLHCSCRSRGAAHSEGAPPLARA